MDRKVKNFPLFRGVTVITPNHYEAGEATDSDPERGRSAKSAKRSCNGCR